MTTLPELAKLSSAVHDLWFDVERLDHNVHEECLQMAIYAGRVRRWWILETDRPPKDPLPPPVAVMVVRDVENVAIQDDAEVGWYTISHLEFDPDTSQLRIVSNLPCEVVVGCKELDIALIDA